MKKKIALLALISVVGMSKAADADNDYTPLVGLAGGVIGHTIVKYAIEKAAETELVKTAAEAADVGPADIGRLGGLGTALATYAYLTSDKNSKKSLNHFAKLVAPCAFMFWLSSTKTFREVAKRVPIIGEYFDCSNEECQGSCKDCRLTKGVLAVGTYQLAKVAVAKMAVKDRI